MPRGSTTSTYRRTNYRRTKPSLTPPEEFLENPQRITATLVRMLEVGECDEHNFMLEGASFYDPPRRLPIPGCIATAVTCDSRVELDLRCPLGA
jgi:hypothetical protein